MKAGNAESWGRFVHLYTPLIYSWCRRADLQESDASDITQDVFRAVSSGVGGLSYGQEGDSFRGWLWTITRHELSRFFQKSSRSPSALGGSDANGLFAQIPDWINDEACPESLSAEAEVIRRAAELIRDDFQEQSWQAFWLSAVEDVPTPVIVKRLGMTPGAIRQAKFRVLARLREFVGFV
ncbi:MAG: RNA polymerase sigma factor [Rubripirellula sp.]